MARKAQAILIEAQKAVDVLIRQYRQDLDLIDRMQKLKSKHMSVAARLSKERGTGLRDVLRTPHMYAELAGLIQEEHNLQEQQQRLWDSMFYPNPVIWLMYKYQAYRGGQNAITTMGDMKKHCTPEGYICTKRFAFLNDYLRRTQNIDVTDTAVFPDDCLLPAFYESALIIGLTNEGTFMEQWQAYEFYTRNGAVAKWQNFVVTN